MENELIIKIKSRDRASFEELYNIYAEQALRVAMAVTKDKTSAADAVQEAFIRVYKNIDSFDESKDFKPWFYRILINECSRLLSRNSKAILISDFLENGIDNSRYDHYNFQEYETLYKAVNKLKDINRIPIILKYLRGFTESEIAQILDININTVKSRLFKGREKLKKYLGLLEGGSENHG
ncbi:RNA polymerase sigma factor [Clostridium thermarum]|uniref:RNA polymerase sigma factor n=1 Tax=Clostridium thermarum TaxID=1716543 RepID=UPI0013D893D0|nr:RNA polymerase sigma factor [Clostridium thermarum]